MVKALPQPDFALGFPQRKIVVIPVHGIPLAFSFLYYWNFSVGFEANIRLQPIWVQTDAFQNNAFQTADDLGYKSYTEPEIVPLICTIVRMEDAATVWIGVLCEYNPVEVLDPATKDVLFTLMPADIDRESQIIDIWIFEEEGEA